MPHQYTAASACPWYLKIYFGLSAIATPLWRQVLLRRHKRGKETETSITQKLALNRVERPEGRLIWGHAVGVGEALALLGLFKRMALEDKDTHFLITSSARTSGQVLSQNTLPERIMHQFAPIDTRPVVERFLSHWQPDVAIWCELDLWPTFINQTVARSIPRILLNVRISEASLNKKQKLASLYRWFFTQFEAVFVQNEYSAQAVQALGLSAERIHNTGTIKALAPALACDMGLLEALRADIGQRPVWMLASSHPEEELIALQAQQILRQSHPDALLIIAPRDPKRGDEIELLCAESLTQKVALNGVHRRSTQQTIGIQGISASCQVYIADTIGEMGLWYRISPVSLIGGSIARVGGHNPYEALALGAQVLHGAHIWNFTESYADLDEEGLSSLVEGVESIAASVRQVWRQAHPTIKTQHNLKPIGEHPIVQRIYETMRSSKIGK